MSKQATPSIFNDYDENGYRVNKYGNKSSRTEDSAIVRNMRFKFKEELAPYGDATIVNWYDDFFWYGPRDEYERPDEGWFVSWLRDMGEIV